MPSELIDPGRRASTSSVGMLREKVRGEVFAPGDDEYSAAHVVWNRARQRRPAVVVRAACIDDVKVALRHARAEGLPVAVRGGGYSPAGMSTSDGVVIDLRRLHAVHVDPLGRTAVVAAGATWGAVDAATQRYGYVVPGVALSSIGVTGSTIGGGFGHLRRAYGLACDNLIGADLVTADGARVVTSGDGHPELLWGLRGGGGNFGVVTSLRFRLRPLPEPVLSGTVLHAARHASPVLRFYRDYTDRLGEDVTTTLSLFGADHSPALADRLGGPGTPPVVAVTVACVGHPDDSESLVRPVRAAAPSVADLIAVQAYARLQAAPDDAYPPGRPAAVGSVYVDEIDDALIATLVERHAAMPAGVSCELHLHHMGGAVGRVARMSTAVPNRAARYLVTAMVRWSDPDSDHESRARDWLDTTVARVRHHAAGGPHIGLQSEPMSSIEAYGAERYLRLAALKRRFDPDNVFVGNQNVAPLA
jgi:FAD/FMN-containing dehydrogenase